MFGGSNSLLTPSTFFALEQSLLFNGRVLRVVSASHSSDLIKMRICAVYNWVWAIGKSWMRRQASFHLGKKCRGIWRQLLFHFTRLPCLGSGKSSVVKRHWHFFLCAPSCASTDLTKASTDRAPQALDRRNAHTVGFTAITHSPSLKTKSFLLLSLWSEL